MAGEMEGRDSSTNSEEGKGGEGGRL